MGPSDQQPLLAERGDECALMLSAARGSEEAYFALVRRLERPLAHLLRRLGAHPDEVEDVLQDTFLRLFKAAAEWHPRAPFRAFILRLARNAFLDHCRARRRREALVAPPSAWDPAEVPAAGNLGARLELADAMAQLSDAHRQVLVFSIHGGLSYREIGEVMGIPEGTVKSRVFHALRHLRVLLDVPHERARV
jgi:RNA polymerase sigma-70 factor (ECF subfamily)